VIARAVWAAFQRSIQLGGGGDAKKPDDR
jgi:hypothetical protein